MTCPRTMFCPSCGVVMRDVPISMREIEVLKLAADGLKTGEIARKLFISIKTVESHQRSLWQKLGVGNMAAAVLWAVKEGLIKI